MGAYAQGKRAAQEEFDAEPYKEQGHLGRNLLMGGAALAPWAGAIGEQRAQPSMAPSGSAKDILRQAQKGDVILSGGVRSDPFKSLISLASGTPKGYHSILVGDDGHIYEAGPDGIRRQPLATSEYMKDHHLQLMRPDLSPAEVEQQVGGVARFAKATKDYATSVKRRAPSARVPLTPEELQYYAAASAYGDAGPGTLFREMFVPKLRSVDAMNANAAATVAGREELAANPGGAAKKLITSVRDSGHYDSVAHHAGVSLHKVPGVESIPSILLKDPFEPPKHSLQQGMQNCVRGVCSSLPAQHLPAGKFVVPGKLPEHVLPGDYARSKLYTHVASHSPTPTALHERILEHGLTGSRLATGLLGMGAVYGVDRARAAIASRLGRGAKKRTPVEGSSSTD